MVLLPRGKTHDVGTVCALLCEVVENFLKSSKQTRSAVCEGLQMLTGAIKKTLNIYT